MNNETTRAITIIPTFNEKENIQILIDKILELPDNLHVLVVDDNSPDGTSEVVERERRLAKKDTGS